MGSRSRPALYVEGAAGDTNIIGISLPLSRRTLKAQDLWQFIARWLQIVAGLYEAAVSTYAGHIDRVEVI